MGEWGFARRASSEARSEELSSATDFSPWVSTWFANICFADGRGRDYHQADVQRAGALCPGAVGLASKGVLCL